MLTVEDGVEGLARGEPFVRIAGSGWERASVRRAGMTGDLSFFVVGQRGNALVRDRQAPLVRDRRGTDGLSVE